VTGAVIASLIPVAAHAAPGDPVTTFGDDGLATAAQGRPPTYDLGADAVRMADGSIVMVGTAFAGQEGDIVVTRIGADRDPVESFGTGGRLQVSRPDRTLIATGVARHGTGVVVVGRALGIASFEESVVVLKVTANGRLDTSFDGDGIRFITPGSEVDHRTIAVSPTGRIALGGFTDDEAQVIVLTPTGSLDTSFSADGLLPLPSVQPDSDVLPLAFQADGKLVVAGATPSALNVSNTWVGRFTTTGSVDLTFDLDGARVVDVGAVEDRPRAVAISGGRVYVATRSGANIGLLALVDEGVTAGSPDSTFSGDGQLVVPSGGAASEPVDITFTPSGALHVASRVAVAGGDRGWEVTETSSTGVWNAAFLTTGRFLRVLDGEGGPVAVATDGATTTLVGDDAGDMAIVDIALDDVIDVIGSSVVHRVNLARMPSFVDLEGSVVSRDGRVVSLGTVRTGVGDDDIDAVLIGLRPNGSRDRSYGTGGAVRIGHPGGAANGIDVVAARSGGVVALVGTRGPTNSGYVVHARTATGGRDTGFGVDGRRTLPVVNDIEATTGGTLTRDPQGRVVVAVAKGVGGAWGTTILRLTTGGALDTTFGAAGVVEVPAATPVTSVHVEVQRNGRVVVVDSNRVIRLRDDGTLDTSFDSDGVLTPIPGLSTRVGGADVQPDGRIVLASPGVDNVTVARLTSRGAPDPTFGSGSAVVLTTGELFAGGVYDLAVQRDGRIVLLVFGSDGSLGSAPVVWRLRYSGSRDTAFGAAGWRAIETPGVEAVGRDLAITRDGDVVVTGSFYEPSPFGMVARLDGGRGARCAGRAATVHLLTGERPTRGDDVIVGTPAADTVAAGRGDDTVCGLGGDDVLRGDRGADRLLGGPGADRLIGGGGRDVCVGGPGTDSARTCERLRQVP
jgi:uncharacterized delta-60 repeat protein